MSQEPAFELTAFFPYRLAVLADAVSQAVAQLYADRFDLSRAEWRIVAALGNNDGMTARDLGPYSTLDKMQVSRAVSRLEQAGLIAREEDASDRRAKHLRLTPAGRQMLDQIIPLVQAREAEILAALDDQERALLDGMIDKLRQRAQMLGQPT